MELIEKVLADDIIPKYPNSIGSGTINLKDENLNIGTVITKLLPYVYAIAGLILLVLLILGGFQLMTSGGNPDKVKAGRGRITAALIGFFIIFMAWFIVKAVEYILGVSVL